MYKLLSLILATAFSLVIAKPVFIIEQGDITQAHVEAIVNAANKELRGGSGVCGAIFKAAGPQALSNACNKYPADSQGTRCPVGQARVTNSFNLTKQGIKKIIHAVGPDCRIITNPHLQDQLLTATYINSLVCAEQEGLTSIAFPFISSGIYAFPTHRAATIAITAIRSYITQHPHSKLRAIHMILFSASEKELFDTINQQLQ